MFKEALAGLGALLLCVVASATPATTAQILLIDQQGKPIAPEVSDASTMHFAHNVTPFGATTWVSYRSLSVSLSPGFYGTGGWDFDFGAAIDDAKATLQPGRYTDISWSRFYEPSKPYMEVSGSLLEVRPGPLWFDILEIEFDSGGNMNKMAVDFSYGSLYGSLRFNSTLATNPLPAVPEPPIWLLCAAGLTLLARRVARRH